MTGGINFMKHLFYRENKMGKWHWNKSCSKFPHGKVKEISYFFKTEGSEFCSECLELDGKISKSYDKKLAG
jgi:hypothetical protein